MTLNRVSDTAERVIAVQDEKKKPKTTPLPKKSYWHLYSLQNLGSEKLIKVVNKILKQEYHLVK